MIDHNFYASPVQASQTLITHILEAMDKELERPFTIALSGGTTPATLFGRFGANMPHIPLGPVFISIGWTSVACHLAMIRATLAWPIVCCLGKVGIPASHYYPYCG